MAYYKKNRLSLNFNLETYDERLEFIKNYLETEEFKAEPPSPAECEKIADYLLWGKEANGDSAAENAGIEMESHWSSKPIESLEALIESPTFNESSLRPLDAPKPLIRKETFSREEARKNAPAHLQADFEALWTQIDELEFTLNTYEYAHGRRKEPPRIALANRLPEERQTAIKESAASLSPYHYLKLKRQLVTLRQQQYDYKDSYSSMILPRTEQFYTPPVDPFTFGDEIKVLPLGTIADEPLIWKTEFDPTAYTEGELSRISKFYWHQKSKPQFDALYFDFRDTDHLYALCEDWGTFVGVENSDESRIEDLVNTFEYYREMANLEPILSDLLDLKLARKDNMTIRQILNEKYAKSYNVNYISTLYCKKILEQIAEAARQHEQMVENLWFEEEWKKCIDCGKWYLRTADNFVRRAKSKDGFSPRCKACEKALREKRKG